MSASQAALIQQIYDNNPASAIQARAVLSMVKGIKYERYPYDLNQSHQMQQLSPKENITTMESASFKVYPNPGMDHTSVEINLPDAHEQIQLLVYDLLGSQVLMQTLNNNTTTVIDLQNLNNGIYFFSIKTREGIIEKQKVIIAK